MDKNFIENCKLLKRHFTKLTQTDTTAQSKSEDLKNDQTAENIINDAKKLLISEQTEELSDEDITLIKEKSLIKYERDLQRYGYKRNHRLCKRDDIKWNDDIFISTLPHPKNNSEYLKIQKTNLVIDKEKINDYANIILSKYDDLYTNSGSGKGKNKIRIKEIEINTCNDNREDGDLHENSGSVKNKKIKIKESEIVTCTADREDDGLYNNSESAKTKNKIRMKEKETDSCTEKREDGHLQENSEPTEKDKTIVNEREIDACAGNTENCYNFEIESSTLRTEMQNGQSDKQKDKQTIKENNVITDIPELKIIPQINKKVDFLEVKRISIEDKDNTDDFDVESDQEIINKNVLSNTLIKWKNYTRKKKEFGVNTQNQKIDSFLNNLQKLKANKINKSKSDLTNDFQNTKVIATKIKPKSSNSDTKVASFEHRFKAQKDIIELQKQKLEEQNKLIEELKLNKITKEARQSFESAKEIRKTILLSSKQNYKVKAQDNKPEMKKIENSDSELNFSLCFNKAPKIVKMMEARAKERHEKRLLIQERKRIIEEERKRQAEEQAQRKVKEEIEQKKDRMERMKKQRELIRQMELRKQMEKKRYIELNEIAAEHYKSTLKKLGLHKFKMLIYSIKIKFEIAKRFYENNIVIHCFQSWRSHTLQIIKIKNRSATDLLRKRLLMTTMTIWKYFHFQKIRSKQVAEDYYEISLQSKCFIAWHKLICEYRIQYVVNAKKADNYYRRILLLNCLTNWRSLPEIMKIERIQNDRKRKWRLRVAEILSDYDPLKNYEY